MNKLTIRMMYDDMIEQIKSGSYNVAIHGCNTFHTMGSGIAPLLNRLSGGKLLEADKKTEYGDINKLGSCSFVDIESPSIRIYNLYTQHSFGREGVQIHWKLSTDGMYNIIQHAALNHGYTKPLSVIIPFIGCGLAGGSLKDLYRMVSDLSKRNYVRDIELNVCTNDQKMYDEFYAGAARW